MAEPGASIHQEEAEEEEQKDVVEHGWYVFHGGGEPEAEREKLLEKAKHLVRAEHPAEERVEHSAYVSLLGVMEDDHGLEGELAGWDPLRTRL